LSNSLKQESIVDYNGGTADPPPELAGDDSQLLVRARLSPPSAAHQSLGKFLQQSYNNSSCKLGLLTTQFVSRFLYWARVCTVTLNAYHIYSKRTLRKEFRKSTWS
jgi:hypothetical protein